MPKDNESLIRSQEERAKVLAKFGVIPTSILKHDSSDKAIDPLVEGGRGYFDESDKKNLKNMEEKYGSKDVAQDLLKKFRTSGMGVRGKSLGLSRFPQNVGRIFTKLYSEPNDVVFDPCAGHNSRMQLVHECGRNYIGNDVSKEFMVANRVVKDILLGEKGQKPLFQSRNTIELREEDSRNISLDDCSVDFILTSPPYWDIEFYGHEKAQLGTDRTYDSFLGEMLCVIKECFRVLKPDKFCVFCINDFRKNGKFYPYHMDTARLFQAAGFILWDTAIINLVDHPIRAIFASQIEITKILPKQHEYAIIGRKPNDRNT